MKIDNKKFKLQDISIEPFPDNKVESMEDVMYLYYTITISSKKKVIKFYAHDFPQIQDLRVLYNRVESQEPHNIDGLLYSVSHLISPYGMEHNIRLHKGIKEDTEYYSLHFYEEFGNSVEFNYLNKEEMLELIEYVENKFKKCIDEYEEEIEMDEEEIIDYDLIFKNSKCDICGKVGFEAGEGFINGNDEFTQDYICKNCGYKIS